MDNVKIIVSNLADANGRLWRRSKILWFGGLFIFLCACCSGFSTLRTMMPGYAQQATATAQAERVQATAQAIETENAQAIAQMTRASYTDTPEPSATARKRNTSQPTVAATEFTNATATIFYVVVTGEPTEPPLAVINTPRASQPTSAPAQPTNDGGTNTGTVGVCTTGCSVSTPPAGCLIKGNVNSQGEKIYHTPGQRDYERTQIKPEEGDAWFCTEQEAVAAGFRHAQR